MRPHSRIDGVLGLRSHNRLLPSMGARQVSQRCAAPLRRSQRRAAPQRLSSNLVRTSRLLLCHPAATTPTRLRAPRSSPARRCTWSSRCAAASNRAGRSRGRQAGGARARVAGPHLRWASWTAWRVATGRGCRASRRRHRRRLCSPPPPPLPPPPTLSPPPPPPPPPPLRRVESLRSTRHLRNAAYHPRWPRCASCHAPLAGARGASRARTPPRQRARVEIAREE